MHLTDRVWVSPTNSCGYDPIALISGESDSVVTLEIDALEVDGQVGQLLLGQLLLPGVFHILADALGAFVVVTTVAHDELAEEDIVLLGLVLQHFVLKEPLGEVTQMDGEAVEVQGFLVEAFAIEVFHQSGHILDQPGDVVHLGHAGVQFCVDNVQGDERGLVAMKVDAQAFPDGLQALLTQLEFCGVVGHDGALQGIAELHTGVFALNGEADVVRQGDQEGLVELLGDLLLDVGDQLLGQGQMVRGDLFHQFPEALLSTLVLHAVAALDNAVIDGLSPVTAEADTAPGNDPLAAVAVYNAQNVVIDDLLDFHGCSPPEKDKMGKKRTSSIRYHLHGRHEIELVKPALPVTFQHFPQEV